MFKLSQETIAIITVGLTLAGLITTTHLSLRAEMRAEREAIRAEAQAARAEAQTAREANRAEAQAAREVIRAQRFPLRVRSSGEPAEPSGAECEGQCLPSGLGRMQRAVMSIP